MDSKGRLYEGLDDLYATMAMESELAAPARRDGMPPVYAQGTGSFACPPPPRRVQEFRGAPPAYSMGASSGLNPFLSGQAAHGEPSPYAPGTEYATSTGDTPSTGNTPRTSSDNLIAPTPVIRETPPAIAPSTNSGEPLLPTHVPRASPPVRPSSTGTVSSVHSYTANGASRFFSPYTPGTWNGLPIKPFEEIALDGEGQTEASRCLCSSDENDPLTGYLAFAVASWIIAAIAYGFNAPSWILDIFLLWPFERMAHCLSKKCLLVHDEQFNTSITGWYLERLASVGCVAISVAMMFSLKWDPAPVLFLALGPIFGYSLFCLKGGLNEGDTPSVFLIPVWSLFALLFWCFADVEKTVELRATVMATFVFWAVLGMGSLVYVFGKRYSQTERRVRDKFGLRKA